ncbi:hypothetical protein J7K25_05505 [bacterium]|nr:hypothetical protein [bacterium]
MKKKKGVLISVFTVFILLFALLKTGEFVVNRKISKLPFKIEDVKISFFGAEVKNLTYIKNDITLIMRRLRIRPSIARMAFAFTGPGEIKKQQNGREITVKGTISGNIKNGNVNIKKTDIKIEKIGDFNIKGSLKNWGKDGQNIILAMDKVNIKEVGDFLNFKIPVEGTVSGNIVVSQENNKKQEINFDVKIEGLKVKKGGEVVVFLKGNFSPTEKKVEIKRGKALIDNKELNFYGNVDDENFSLSFEGKEIEIEKLFELLPEEIKKKYRIDITGGIVNFDDFFVKKVKKNLRYLES